MQTHTYSVTRMKLVFRKERVCELCQDSMPKRPPIESYFRNSNKLNLAISWQILGRQTKGSLAFISVLYIQNSNPSAANLARVFH